MDRLPSSDIANRYSILQYNSLFGYQYDKDNGVFFICFCSDDLSDDTIEQLKMVSCVDSLKYGDWIGHSYLSVHWTEHDKIPDLLNTMLLMGHWFTTNNIAKANFSPKLGDEVFTNDIMESKMVSFISDIIKQHPQDVHSRIWINTQHFKIWNYKTPEGKQLCHTLRRMTHKKTANWNSESNYLLWAIFRDEPDAIQNRAKTPPAQMQQDDIDDGLCLVCMANIPNTQVLPCGCIVVCAVCSEALKKTSDKHTCIKCRRPIVGEPILLN